MRVSIDQPRRKSYQPKLVANVMAVADSGAQSDVWSLSEFLKHGFSREDLHPVSLNLCAANKSKITIVGAFLVCWRGKVLMDSSYLANL